MSRTNPPIAGQHNGRENPQQTHLLECEGHSPANQEGDREAHTLFTINTQRVNPIEVKLTVNGVDMTMELDTGGKALDLAQAIESADKYVRDAQGQRSLPGAATVHAMSPRQGSPKRQRRPAVLGKADGTPCSRCGGKHSPRKCRFKTAV